MLWPPTRSRAFGRFWRNARRKHEPSTRAIPKLMCQQPVEVVARPLAAHTKPTGRVRAAVQTALDFLADRDVLALNLIAHRDALDDELPCVWPLGVREIEIENHPAPVR